MKVIPVIFVLMLAGSAAAHPDTADGECHRAAPDSVVHCHVETGQETPHPSGEITCYDFPKCSGCGCKAGPGWRGPPTDDGERGKCLSHTRFKKVCGDPPGAPCTHEPSEREALNAACMLKRFDKDADLVTTSTE